jgi:hypothetical protein
MVRALFILAVVIDLGVAVLLIAVSGFIFGTGPESMRGGFLATTGWTAMIVFCLAAPATAFFLRWRGQQGVALMIVWLPAFVALGAALVRSPY